MKQLYLTFFCRLKAAQFSVMNQGKLKSNSRHTGQNVSFSVVATAIRNSTNVITHLTGATALGWLSVVLKNVLGTVH